MLTKLRKEVPEETFSNLPATCKKCEASSGCAKKDRHSYIAELVVNSNELAIGFRVEKPRNVLELRFDRCFSAYLNRPTKLVRAVPLLKAVTSNRRGHWVPPPIVW